jgi:hypothetical protein
VLIAFSPYWSRISPFYSENDRVEQNIEIEMASHPFSWRRGMQDIWDAAERDIMLQESIISSRKIA